MVTRWDSATRLRSTPIPLVVRPPCSETKVWRRACFPLRQRQGIGTAVERKSCLTSIRSRLRAAISRSSTCWCRAAAIKNRRRARYQSRHRPTAPSHAFLRAGIKQGRKRVILTTAIFEKEQMNHVTREQLNCTEIRIATLVWQGRTNPEIAGIGDTSEQVIRNHLLSIFDKLGVWSWPCMLPLTGESAGQSR